MAGKFTDVDGDLLADFPTDPAKFTSPSPIVFSYIAEGDPDIDAEAIDRIQRIWQDLLAKISERTGRSVEYRHYTKTEDQLADFARGEVHVVGLNTGTVEEAVAKYGFIPVCTLGNSDGNFGYTMKVVVPDQSAVRALEGLRGKRITFTRPNSNSGFKAAFVHLMDAHGMLPERDYQWGFSLDHDKSIQLVAAGETDAAAVASDVLARMIETGLVDGKALRTIYESERFPPATIGFAHNLAPELREGIRQVLVEFDWKGTALSREFGPMGAVRFVPVNYKDDWANVRRIEQSLRRARTSK
jgi:phosphonate transport system substrate-binding protein